MRINGQFGRSVLGISIGLMLVGASSTPVSAQSTSLLFPHIRHTGSGETFALAKQPPPPRCTTWTEFVQKLTTSGGRGGQWWSYGKLPSKFSKGCILLSDNNSLDLAYVFQISLDHTPYGTDEDSFVRVLSPKREERDRLDKFVRDGKIFLITWLTPTNGAIPYLNSIPHDRTFQRKDGMTCLSTVCLLSGGLSYSELSKILMPNPLESSPDNRTPTIEPPQPKPSNVPALPTPVQFPTQAEFDRVDKIARANPGKGLSNSDRNARQGLKGVWRRNNAPIASFLGGWQAKDGNQIYVYPSNQQRRVCVITQSNTQTQLSIGTVTGSELRYDGDKGLFLTRSDGGDMIAARASKSSGLTPAFAISGSGTDLSDDTIESMNLAKCITELPGGTVAQKPAPQNPSATTANLAPIEISNLGCTENLKIPYCRSLSADSGILFETFNSTKKSDGSIDIKFIAFNRGSADALIEIYDAQGKLQEIQIIDGNKPPTGFLKNFGDMFGRYPLSFFSRYPVGDIRKDLEKANVNDRRLGKEPNEIEMTLPPGGSIKITKSSSYAQLYNTLMLSLDTSKLAQKSDFKSLTSYRQMAIRFVKESGKNTKINIFKSAPNAQAVFSLDFIDPRKMAEILQKFFAYSFTAEGKPLGEDPLKNPIVGGVADIVVDDVNEGIEVALKKYIGPVWGRLAEASRTGGDGINIVAKATDLSHAITNGENGTITVRHRSK